MNSYVEEVKHNSPFPYELTTPVPIFKGFTVITFGTQFEIIMLLHESRMFPDASQVLTLKVPVEAVEDGFCTLPNVICNPFDIADGKIVLLYVVELIVVHDTEESEVITPPEDTDEAEHVGVPNVPEIIAVLAESLDQVGLGICMKKQP